MPLPEPVFTMIGEVLENADARQRVIWLLEQLRNFFPEPVEDAFISEARDNEGRQVLLSVWAFTRSFVIEFKNPLQADNFDLTPLSQISYIDIYKTEIDFNIPRISDAQTMAIMVSFRDQLGRFQASRRNCVQLQRIARERLLPAFLSHWGTRGEAASST